MKVSLKKAFSILDGRLSTSMDDIYEMLNYIFDADLFTHQLPSAMDKIKEINPVWFQAAVNILTEIKEKNSTNNFSQLMNIIDSEYADYEVELFKIESWQPHLIPIHAYPVLFWYGLDLLSDFRRVREMKRELNSNLIYLN